MAYRTRNSSSMLGCAAILVLIATLFFWLAAFSTPFIKSIYYLETRANDVRFGNFGWCLRTDLNCLQHVGYNWRPQIPSGNGSTGAHILVALSAAFGSIAFFTLLHSATNLNSGGASFFLVLFTNLLAFISFLIVVITWATAKRRFNNDDGPNTFFDAHYGPAFALVIVGWLLYLAAIPLVFVGWFRNRGYRNDAPVTTTTTTTTRRKRWF